MKILFMQAGGSIDKAYLAQGRAHGYNFSIGSPAFERILERTHPSFEPVTQCVLQKDSLDMTDHDRQVLVEACRTSEWNKIIITHGTNTILQTAQALSLISNKTIVLTGAFSPELFKDSDADFNIGMAVASVQTLPSGVYVSLNGLVRQWDKVTFDANPLRLIELTD